MISFFDHHYYYFDWTCSLRQTVDRIWICDKLRFFVSRENSCKLATNSKRTDHAFYIIHYSFQQNVIFDCTALRFDNFHTNRNWSECTDICWTNDVWQYQLQLNEFIYANFDLFAVTTFRWQFILVVSENIMETIVECVWKCTHAHAPKKENRDRCMERCE